MMLRYLGILIIMLSLVGIIAMAVATVQKPELTMYTLSSPSTVASIASNIGGKTYFAIVSTDFKSILRNYGNPNLPYVFSLEISGSPVSLNTPLEAKLLIIGTYMPVPHITGAVKPQVMNRFLTVAHSNIIYEVNIIPGMNIDLRIGENKLTSYRYVYMVIIYVVDRNTLVRDLNVMPSQDLYRIGQVVDSALNGSWAANGILNSVMKNIDIYYINPLTFRFIGYIEVGRDAVLRTAAVAFLGLALIFIDYKRDPEAVKETFRWLVRRRRSNR